MNIKQLVNKLLKISDDVTSIEKALIYSFADKIAVDTNKSQWLKNYLSDIDLRFLERSGWKEIVLQDITDGVALNATIQLIKNRL